MNWKINVEASYHFIEQLQPSSALIINIGELSWPISLLFLKTVNKIISKLNFL